MLLAIFLPTEIKLPMASAVGLDFLPVSVLSGFLGFGLLLSAYIKSYSKTVFRSYASRVPLLTLSHKSTQKNYKKFVSALQKSIVLAHKQNNITLQDRLVGEMKDLRRLKNAGVIKENVYNQAQSAILTHKHYK